MSNENSKHMAPLEVHFRPEGDHWLGLCPSLDIGTQAPTYNEAQENLKEAILLFFESCLRRGTLEQVLKESGFEPVQIKQVQNYAAESIPYPANCGEPRRRV